VFLDILLDHDNSFHMLERIDKTSFHIIFTTAYDEYAIKAFRYNATDYLLKPIVIEDLIEAINRVEEQIQKKEFVNREQIKQLSDTILKKKPINFLTVSGMDRVDFIQPDDIVYLKSAGRYTEFYLRDKKRKIISSRPIGQYETLLSEDQFYRIHNSFLINLNALININKRAGNYCELSNGVSLPISRRRFEGLIKLMRLK
jgi:two-component system LytT family response regulator